MHKHEIWKKGLVVGIIFLLMLATLPMIYGKNDSEYNLKIKIRVWDKPKLWGFQFLFYNLTTDITYHIDVYNEGPDSCFNYTVKIDQIFLFGGGCTPDDWFFLWFTGEYEGYMIESGNTSSIEITRQIGHEGLWMAKATIISEDKNQEDNIARWFYYVYY